MNAFPVSKERWSAIIEEPPLNFDKFALLSFVKSAFGTTLSSYKGKLINKATCSVTTPMTIQNEVTGETLLWYLHIVMLSPAISENSSEMAEKILIEFKSWTDPLTGEECVNGFQTYGESIEEEDQQDFLNIIESFFPLYSEYDIKEPAEY